MLCTFLHRRSVHVAKRDFCEVLRHAPQDQLPWLRKRHPVVSYAGKSCGPQGSLGSQPGEGSGQPTPGKQTLVEHVFAPVVQQRAADQHDRSDETTVHTAASRGVATPSSPLPFSNTIQRAFGRRDVSAIQAHTGAEAAASAQTMGADAYATGDHVVLGHGADLHTVAHEAAHVVQQRGGVQLKGGVGATGDAYERHADTVADRVVAGQSAEDLLNQGAVSSAPGTTQAVQRKEAKDDAKILENQASLKGTDVEIPALEGALLTTRKEAVKLGLLSQASFDAGLALSQAMTQLQPTVAAKGAVDPGVQERAAVAAQQLFSALQGETAGDKNFKMMPSIVESSGISSQNPYTEEVRVTTSFLLWSTTHDLGSWFQQLPGFIRQGKWDDAFRGYRRMLDGLDLWVSDQLRKKGKGTPEEALGNAQQHYAQLRTGLEQIADKHATRLPALFHPDPKTVEKEKAAGQPAADTIPMNVYFWKDAKDGKFHLYDLTTPSRPHEQTIVGQPTAAMMNTFFEEVARYPEGEVRYTLPGGTAGIAPTTGKTKWYEWVGYAGLAIAAVGLAFLTAGASIPATVCFAAGAVAGGVSAGGHLVDTTRLGTATTATVVLDVAQIVASFASFGAMSITVKASGAAAALAASRWFVPLVGTAASADVVQLVALTDITFTELNKIQNGAGTPEDKQRAMAVLLTQLIVVSGLTALSVQGARNARALAGKPLEVVEQNGVKVLRLVGDASAGSAAQSEVAAKDMRWQMELKNQKLTAKGEPPRYPDLDAAVKQGMSDFEAAKTRGFPYGFKDKAAFDDFAKQLKEGIAAKPAPSGGIPVPTDKAAVQGSAVYRPAADDIDVALLVEQKQFDQLIEQSFPNQVAKVRARGIDPLRMTMGDAQTAAEKTLANAVEAGIIKRDDVVPRLSDIRKKLQTIAGKHVDLSIVRHGGKFDRGPYIPIP
ncbi:MAG: DUF4157 domain-containing protein [Deltaproteobacteria bacterium]|nr:MAG: DUF4157 domain-containing protein [Deltaproteobacteria bacterium]